MNRVVPKGLDRRSKLRGVSILRQDDPVSPVANDVRDTADVARERRCAVRVRFRKHHRRAILSGREKKQVGVAHQRAEQSELLIVGLAQISVMMKPRAWRKILRRRDADEVDTKRDPLCRKNFRGSTNDIAALPEPFSTDEKQSAFAPDERTWPYVRRRHNIEIAAPRDH